jgi:hypothetical protein
VEGVAAHGINAGDDKQKISPRKAAIIEESCRNFLTPEGRTGPFQNLYTLIVEGFGEGKKNRIVGPGVHLVYQWWNKPKPGWTGGTETLRVDEDDVLGALTDAHTAGIDVGMANLAEQTVALTAAAERNLAEALAAEQKWLLDTLKYDIPRDEIAQVIVERMGEQEAERDAIHSVTTRVGEAAPNKPNEEADHAA